MSTKRISYEIIPGSIFPRPPGLLRASFRVQAKAQELAEGLFESELLKRLGLEGKLLGAHVARGGWQGSVSPSLQLLFDPKARRDLLGAYAAALGLIWRQDAVAVSFLHPEHDGRMLFINLKGGLSDKEFERALTELAEKYLPDDVFLDFARADFELESTDWSVDHGEGYRQRLREAGRSDLLDWAETVARPEAERFLKTFDWSGGTSGKRRRRREER